MSHSTHQNTLTIAALGQCLTQGFELYRNHWQEYGKLAIAACLWTFIPVLGWSRYRTLKLAIAHHALLSLRSNHQDPAPVSTGIQLYHNLKQKRGLLFWSQVRVWCQIWGWGLASCFGGIILFAGITAVFVLAFSMPEILESGNGEPSLFGAVMGVLAISLGYIVGAWQQSKLLLIDFPLIMSKATTVRMSLQQTMPWAKGSALKLQGLMLCIMLLTVPLIGVCLLPAQALTTLTYTTLRPLLNLPASAVSTAIFTQIPSLYSPLIVGLTLVDLNSLPPGLLPIIHKIFYSFNLVVAMIVTIPLWQTVKAALYDQLTRQEEGYDLMLGSKR